MTSYIDLPSSLTASFTDGVEEADVTEAAIYCTALEGNIFSSTIRRYIEWATTWTVATGAGTYLGQDTTILPGVSYPEYEYPVQAYCSNGTPDYNPSSIIVIETNAATDKYFPAEALLWRISTSSTWSVFPLLNGGATSGSQDPPSPNTCTHTGPQT